VHIVEQLEALVNDAAVAAALFDVEMRYIACSKLWAEDYGLVGQQIRGRSQYELFPEINDDWKAVHIRCLEGASEGRIEDAFARPDGRVDFVNWSVHPWYTEKGEVGGLLMFAEKVTERKQLEQALREAKLAAEALRSSEERFETIFRSSPIAMTLTSPDGERRFVDVNVAFESVTGYRRDEVIGRTLDEVAIWVDPAQEEDAQLQLRSLGRLSAFEHQFRVKNGEIRTGLLSIEPVRVNDKPSFITANVDITERKRAEVQRDALQSQLN
jgi:PAS domain S-box-containing protein